jgi:CRISPR-associated protein Cas2
MFVSIAVDPGSVGRAMELADLLAQYGFKMVQRGLWESTAISPDTLTRIKRDLDRATDASDKLRLFQFPMEGTLVLSSLKNKKWRRMVAREAGPARPVSRAPAAGHRRQVPPPSRARPVRR